MPGLPRGYWFTPKPSFLKHTAEQYLTWEVKKVDSLKFEGGGMVENRQNHSADTTGFLYFFFLFKWSEHSIEFSQIVSLEAFRIHLFYSHLLFW